MNFLELSRCRCSVRKFDGEPVSSENIEKIVTAGVFAPTAKNQQPEKIYVLKSDDAIKKLKECTPCDYGTKTAFLVCYDEKLSWKRDSDGVGSGYVDASIVATHMMLEAASIGVGSTWIMYFDSEKVKQTFELEKSIVPVCILVCGHPAKDAPASPNHNKRKAIGEIAKEL